MHKDPRITRGEAIWKKWWLYLLLLVVGIALVYTVFSSGRGAVRSDTASFVQAARSGRVEEVHLDSDDIHFSYELKGDYTDYEVVKEEGADVRDILLESGVPLEQIVRIEVYDDPTAWGKILRVALNFLPLILIVGMVAFFATRASRSVAAKPDPVCGIKVTRKRAVAASTFQDVTYFFCSLEHKAAFDQDPVRYLLKP